MVVLFEDPHTLPTATFLMQVFITLIVCKALAKLLSYIRQPQVIGQIIAGILFGPSILGHAPGWSAAIWPTSSLPAFQLIANLGLIFFMFFLGIELDLDQIKTNWKTTIPIACASILFPVGVGCAVGVWFYDMNEGLQTSKVAFLLFIASGFGFSAFPVLATLLNSNGLLNRPIGVQTISLAAVEDIVVWVILAIASAFSSGGSALQGLYTLLLTLAFIAIMVFIIRPILRRLHAFYLRRNDDTNVYLVVVCFLLLLVAAFTTEVMGIHAFFGAFVSGLCIPRKGELTNFMGVRIELIVVEFFLPLYFANSGLRTHLDLLNTGRSWWTLVVLIILASIAKILPVTLATKLCTRKPWYYCSSIGVLMNTRGIVQLVVLNIGVELKVISPIIFAIFVLMATILTFLTSPILYLLYGRDFNKEKLSMDHISEELREMRESYASIGESASTIQTISNIPAESNELRHSTSRTVRQLSSDLLPHNSFLTLNNESSYPHVNLNATGDQTAVLANIVTMPTCPRRSVNMTRF